MNCPWCKTSLDLVTLGPVTVDQCRKCRAEWFDHTELAALVGPAAQVLAGRPGSGRGDDGRGLISISLGRGVASAVPEPE